MNVWPLSKQPFFSEKTLLWYFMAPITIQYLVFELEYLCCGEIIELARANTTREDQNGTVSPVSPRYSRLFRHNISFIEPLEILPLRMIHP